MADLEAPLPTPIYEVATGAPANIPENMVPQAIASGKYAFAKGAQVPVIHPDTGEAGTIPAENSYEAFKSGYKLQPMADQHKDFNEQKYGGIGGEALSALAGAAKTHSFGLSSFIAPETQKTLEETNPIAYGAGEYGSLLLPDPLGAITAVSKGGQLLEKAVGKALPEAGSVAGKVIREATAKGIGYGAEGAAYGLGQSISEDALGDHDLLSQHTLSNIGLSAAIGGTLGSVLGAGMGAIGRDASSAEEKLAAQKIAETSQPGSAEEMISNTGLPASEKSSLIEGLTKQKSNAKEILEAGQIIGADVLPAQTSASDYVQSWTSGLSQSRTIPGIKLQQQIDSGFGKVKDVLKESLGDGQGLSDFEAGSKVKGQIQDAIDDMYAPLKKAYAEREAVGKVIDLPDEARIKLHDNLTKLAQDYGSVGSKGSKVIDAYADRAIAQNTVGQMDKLISEIGGEQRMAFRAADSETAHALGQVKDTLEDFKLKQIIKQGKAAGGEEGEAIAKELIAEHKAVQAKYADFKETLNDLTSAGRISKKLNTYGTVESVLDSIPNEKLMDKMFDKKNSAGLKTLQEKFPEVFKTIVDHKKSQILEKSMQDGEPRVQMVLKALKELSPEMKKLMFSPEELTKLNAANTWVEAMPKNVGPSGTPKGIEYMKAAQNPIWASLAHAKDYSISHLLKFSSPAEANKTMLLINAEKQGLKSAQKIKDGVSAIMDHAGNAVRPFIALSSAKLSAEHYKEQTKKIAEMVNNPQNLHDKITATTQGVYEHAPKLAGAFQQSMVNGLSFLNSKIDNPPALGPFVKETEPTQAQVSKFNRYYEAVEDPTSLLKKIQDHTLSSEGIEAVQTVYPSLFNKMKQEVMEQASSIKNPSEIPYKTKMMISKFLGEPIHPSQTPQSIAMNQMIYNKPTQGQQQQKRGNETGESKIKIASRMSLTPNDDMGS